MDETRSTAETPPPNDLDRLLDRARRGDAGVLPELRAALDECPALWRQAGDLAAHVERAWIKLVAGPDAFLAESLSRRLAELKANFARGHEPSPLEALLIDRVVVTWLEVAHADAAAAQAGDITVRQAAFTLKRQGEAHRRHLNAIAALATIRRLLPGYDGPSSLSGPVRSGGSGGSLATGSPAATGEIAMPLAVFDASAPAGGRIAGAGLPEPSRKLEGSSSRA